MLQGTPGSTAFPRAITAFNEQGRQAPSPIRFGTGDKGAPSLLDAAGKIAQASSELSQLRDDFEALRQPAAEAAMATPANALNAARSRCENREEALSRAVENIAKLQDEVDRLSQLRDRSRAQLGSGSAGASSSAAPRHEVATGMTHAGRGRKIEELSHLCKQLVARSAEEEKLQKFRDVIDELNRTHPVSLDGNPAAKEALMKAVGELLDPQPTPRRGGRRSARPASNDMAEGLMAAVKRGNIEHVVAQLSEFIAHAKRHSGSDLRNGLVDWTARGLLRTISIALPRGMAALDALERSFLVWLTGATHHASTTRAHVEMLRQAAAKAQGADQQALLEAHARLKSHEGWKAHGELLKQLFRGIAQVLCADDIAKHDKETAPRLVAHYRNQIAELKQQSSARAIPQTHTVPAARPDPDAARFQLTGRVQGIEQQLQHARDRLASAQAALPAFQAEVTQARGEVSRLELQHAEDTRRATAAADEARARAARLKNLTLQKGQAWEDILKSEDILTLFDDPSTLSRVVERHVGLTKQDMIDRLKEGRTAYVGSFRSPQAFLNALVEVTQIIHGNKDFEFTPGQEVLVQLNFPASSGWMRLPKGKYKEVPKSMVVSVTLNDKKQITHVHPNVQSEEKRQAARESRGFSALA
jgi:hypothetical protein